jgi:5-methylcytosine-specific restriction protein A
MPISPKAPALPWIAKKKRAANKTNNQALYNSKAWRRVAKQQLGREPICRICYQNGALTPATLVDHITPIRLGGPIFAIENLQSLCPTCHNIKSGKEAHY